MTQKTQINPTVTSRLLEDLREAILSGRYTPGMLLRQETVAEEFGVSRVPVRQVLQVLSNEGLVKLQPRRGAVVSGFSDAEISDVFSLRSLLEPDLLRAALPLLRPEDFDALEEINARYGEAIAREEKRLYGELNAEFHLALYRRADRPMSQQVLSTLLQSSNRYTRVELGRPEDLARAHAEHTGILQHCRAGDIDQAEAALRAHIGDVQKGAKRYGFSQTS